VVLLRGVNVGGHRTYRPTTLAEQLKHLDAVNIGAAGTFVIRRPGTPAQLRAEFARRLPFDAEIMICPGREISRRRSRRHSPLCRSSVTVAMFMRNAITAHGKQLAAGWLG
jgi:hypothetical protein